MKTKSGALSRAMIDAANPCVVRLVVYLRDGRELSGNYDYLSALARLDFARTLPAYVGFEILGAA